MTGHEPIIALRRSGFKPAYVWLQDSGVIQTDHSVVLAKDENPQSLDLRFLVGVTVFAESTNKARLKSLKDASIAAKSARTVATLYQRLGNGRLEVLDVSDTDGC